MFNLYIDWGQSMKGGQQELDDEKYWIIKTWDKTSATDEDVQLVKNAIKKAEEFKQ